MVDLFLFLLKVLLGFLISMSTWDVQITTQVTNCSLGSVCVHVYVLGEWERRGERGGASSPLLFFS